MKVVFLGPTLPREEAKKILPEASFLRPAAQGDIVSICRAMIPVAIGIIDGLFRNSLSVWHKEITFALSRGIRVFGAASIGALRAVECEPWGAEPIGRIAQLVKTGAVSDADVALAHGDAEHNWRPLSVPMVNVMATLDNATDIPIERRQKIMACACQTFYAERTWASISKDAKCTKAERACISSHLVDQKAIDAREMLAAMAADGPRSEPLLKPEHHFDSYGGVLHGNDVRFVGSDKVPRRAWQIAKANAWCTPQASDRQLAIEMAKLLFPDQEEPIAFDPAVASKLDLIKHEWDLFTRDERLLARARAWVTATDCGFGDAPRRLAYLRASGIYEQFKMREG